QCAAAHILHRTTGDHGRGARRLRGRRTASGCARRVAIRVTCARRHVTDRHVVEFLHAGRPRSGGVRVATAARGLHTASRMPSRSRVVLRLDRETRPLHPESDFPWLELMASDVSQSRYIDQLVATYGFEAPVEAALALTPNLA